jgi:hypothetical protein
MKEDEIPAIDAVIMWVDGNDPFHKAKMENYLENTNSVNFKSLRTRYDHVNEIEFCVKSILKYAKFVRNIFIVTDSQVPDFLKDQEKAQQEYPNVFIVDHKIIFEGYTQYLPTFNSRSIATMIHRIPGLSASFIIFNDDVFLIKKVTPKDFFIDNNPVIRGVWKPLDENVFLKKVKRVFLQLFNKTKLERAGHYKAQQLIAKKTGFHHYFKSHHVPLPIRKSTIETFLNKEKVDHLNNISHKFRHASQFLPESLSNHIEIKNNTAVLSNDYKLSYIQNYKKPFLWLKFKIRSADKNENKLFLCLQSLDQCPPHKIGFIKKWFESKYN